MKKFLKILLVLLIVVIAALSFVRWRIDHEVARVTSIPMAVDNADLSITIDPTFTPKVLPPTGEPQHPFMATTDTSVMHAGSWESDTHPAAALFSEDATVTSRRAGGAIPRQCATFTFTSTGHPLILCGGLTSFRLQLLDPETLELLNIYDLPMRPSTFEGMVRRDPSIIMSDTSGGAYLYMDHEDHAVFADSTQHIRRVGAVQKGEKWKLVEAQSWDMGDYVPHDCYHYNNLKPTGECDGITALMPDYNGLIWWVTRNGRIGSLNMETGHVELIQLDGEEIQNSFALDENGTYIVSDHAMYHHRLIDGVPVEQWRLPYDRGTGRKVGSINQGSGTSPTILGGGKYITFADNADDRIALVVAYTGDVPEGRERQICRVPVFKSGGSATDNSMIGYDRSIILENNHGFTSVQAHEDYTSVTGGVVRVDVREDESGCDIVWESDLRVPSVVPKLSLGAGIAYLYSFDILDSGERLWSLVGLDFETGREVVRIPTGTGKGYNNNWASIGIAPTGEVYIGTRQGIVRVRE